jgi:cytochrome c oxidase cbb3-type subunit I/II
MAEKDLDVSLTTKKLKAMQALGVPYSDSLVANADAVRNAQALEIKASLEKSMIKTSETKEIIAMIAYLQRLGTDIKAQNTSAVAAPAPAEVAQ